MGSISNRFFVSALDDGTTLHGNLSSTAALSQGWNGTSAVPDWTQAANQPTIYLTLLSGAELVQPTNTYTWYYNGTAIVFDGTTGISTTPSGLFQKTTYNVTYGGVTKAMPALKIIGNLAGYGGNVDMDSITFKGTYTPSGGSIDFESSIQVRITSITKGGYLGVLNFLNGIADITEANQNITIYADLYGGEQGDRISITQSNVAWYINGVAFSTSTFTHSSLTTVTVGGVTFPALQLNEKDVTDHATIRCDFIQGTEVKYSAYVGVDDMQDPEFMYIQYNGANGNAASLRKSDDSALFYIWIGKNNDPTIDTAWTTFKLKLLDGNGDIITASGLANNIPNPDANGWRTLPLVSTAGANQGKAYVDVAYDTVNTYGKNVTGIIVAYTS